MIWRNLFKKNKNTFPDFLIIGAQKSGTSSLYKYLNQSPYFQGSTTKEIHYFDKYIHKGKNLEWYKSHFINSSNKKNPLFFEATPNYIYHESIPKTLKELKPNLKFILLLREPVSRAYSAWNMFRLIYENENQRKGFSGGSIYQHFMEDRESFPSFSEALDIELNLIEKNESIEPSIIRRGFYAQQLEKWLEFFPIEQFCILDFNDFKKDVNGSLNTISKFLGVENEINLLDEKPINKREYTSKISEKDKNLLMEVYLKHNLDLEKILGKTLNWKI